MNKFSKSNHQGALIFSRVCLSMSETRIEYNALCVNTHSVKQKSIKQAGDYLPSEPY